MSTNHYIKLRKHLPQGYLQEISETTKTSISLINKVIRGLREDNKGILVELYRIAAEEKKKQAKYDKKLAILKKRIND